MWKYRKRLTLLYMDYLQPFLQKCTQNPLNLTVLPLEPLTMEIMIKQKWWRTTLHLVFSLLFHSLVTILPVSYSGLFVCFLLPLLILELNILNGIIVSCLISVSLIPIRCMLLGHFIRGLEYRFELVQLLALTGHMDGTLLS